MLYRESLVPHLLLSQKKGRNRTKAGLPCLRPKLVGSRPPQGVPGGVPVQTRLAWPGLKLPPDGARRVGTVLQLGVPHDAGEAVSPVPQVPREEVVGWPGTAPATDCCPFLHADVELDSFGECLSEASDLYSRPHPDTRDRSNHLHLTLGSEPTPVHLSMSDARAIRVEKSRTDRLYYSTIN